MTALGQNLATILIGRFFAGLFGVAPIAVLGGIITDCWNAVYRGVALAFCICLVFAGPTFGPIVGGFIVENTSWRWTMWVVVIAGLALGFVAVFTYPESYPPKVLQIRARSIRRKMDNPTIVSPLDLEGLSLEKVFQLYLVRPWVLFFTEPILVSLTFYQAFIYGLMYICYQSYPIAFMEVRGWSQGFASLALIGIIVGVVMGTATVVIYNQLYFKRKVQANDGKFEPEARLPLMIFGGCLVPTGLFWYAWTSDPSIPWPSEVCAGILVGWGMYTIFIQCFSYIIDCYTDMANSAMAANGAVRSVFGAVFPLFANYMYHNLGVDWASSLVGFLTLAMVPVPIIFYYYGARIRARSKKARSSAQSLPFLSGTTQNIAPFLGICNAEFNHCACLSVLYLLLERLRIKSQLIAPDDLFLIRDSLEKLTAVIYCEKCPQRYFSIIQNAVILGVVCLCIAESYARVLEAIDREEARASRTGEQKLVNIFMIAGGLLSGQSDLESSYPFSAEISPAEWKVLMRRLVKAEVLGIEGRRDKCFLALIEQLDERQRRWHETPPAPDCPPGYRSTCRFPDRIPTCLKLIDDARKLVDLLDI
ncbi:MFS general substrate transporter [Aspergillus phoenicis ATCC 13157]|uniref:MFS general substrate transporter n=1 Tax=Aspergillus phoenicis ATCC 13157 TaxID=1353007 RepID=A0A370PCA9_ASPPH|nr:MFS general substrate transporter [Aspergillus phoenicis ATCC 13157]